MTILNDFKLLIRHLKTGPDAIDLAYIETGQGDKTLLFVHGLGHSLSGWLKNIEELQLTYHCIAIDLPGNGYSPGSRDYPYSMRFFADCIAGFIIQKKLKNVYLAGHSMGGQISLTLAYYHPGLISGLILCAPAGLETFNNWERSLYRNTLYFAELLSDEESSLRQAIRNSFYKMPEQTSWFIQELVDLMKKQDKGDYRYMLDNCINAMLDEPVAAFFPAIDMPVAIIFGENDGLIPNRFLHPVSTRQLALDSARHFPEASVTMIPLCGHFLQWEKPRELNRAIQDFLKLH